MPTPPPDDLLPVLVADLADEEGRAVLDAAAARGGRVWVPLATAPVSAALHVLEVHLPNREPALYIAEPLGPPTSHGFPLRIQPMPSGRGDAPSKADRPDTQQRRRSPPAGAPREPAASPRIVRGRHVQSALTLSASHTKDLSSYVGPLPEDDGTKSGASLAGGKLVIEERIGRGGVGAVYKARHRELMMPVAVKVLHASFQNDIDFARRFYAEALAASRLDHPNITRVIDFGQEPDGQLYIAMEFLDGVELRRVLEKERKLPAPRIATIMMQVCAALSHAHARGILHRDIKPENLLLIRNQDDDGRPIEVVKVCDFGIALHRAHPSDEAGTVAGTPEYMSPEQCRGDTLDARSEVYACGVVLYELATGQLPFVSEDPGEVLKRQRLTPPLPPSKIDQAVDPRLEAIIMKALAKDPAQRQPSMRELRNELRELLNPVLVEASPAPPPSLRELPPDREGQAGSAARKAFPTLPDDDVAEDAPAASPAAEPPAWLERGSAYLNEAQRGGRMTTSAQEPAAPATTGGEIDNLAQTVVAWSARLTKTTDPQAFANAVKALEPALHTLAARGEVDALWTVSSALHGIATDGSGAIGSRALSIAKLLHVFEDPSVLVLIADQLLQGPAEARDKARRLLIHAGVAGAYGLYGARVRLANVPAVRTQFTGAMKDFGPKAWPVLRASLEKIASTSKPNPATLQLAEDLLLCAQSNGDESAGHVVLKFLRWTHSGVCRAATAAIVRLWGDRAKPVLVGMVQSKEDVVRIAGIAGLRQLGAIDEHLVPRLHAILMRRVPAGEEVRAAAAVALANVSESARQPAVSILAQLLTPSRDAPAPAPGEPTGALSQQDAVVLAMARSLLIIGGKTYRGLVAERAERSAEPLRTQLRGLLAQHGA